MTVALEGIRVLDLSRLLPGPFCTTILADMGADVLKVEDARPGSARDVLTSVTVGVPVSEDEEEKALAYNCLARNKRSIALNLKTEEGKQVFYQLARSFDVIVEASRPGVVKSLGIDYETISKLNPRIIYCSISGYGQDGPYRDLPGHDPNYISIGGILSMAGDRNGHPTHPGGQFADVSGGGMTAALGILVALLARERTGKGQYIDIAMLDGVIWQISHWLARELSGARWQPPKRGQREIDAFETKDGKYITLVFAEVKFWENLCRALERPDYIPYTNAQGEKRDEIFAFFKEIFRTKTRDEWFKLLVKEGAFASPIYELGEVANDPHVIHRQMFIELDHPTVGKVKQVWNPLRLSDTPPQFRSFAPFLGQHTAEILRDLGYTQESIEEMERKGAVKTWKGKA